jgi:hypothetical protein
MFTPAIWRMAEGRKQVSEHSSSLYRLLDRPKKGANEPEKDGKNAAILLALDRPNRANSTRE